MNKKAPQHHICKSGGAYFDDSEVLNSSFVHLMKFSAEKSNFPAF
jgi:hypothetical protein